MSGNGIAAWICKCERVWKVGSWVCFPTDLRPQKSSWQKPCVPPWQGIDSAQPRSVEPSHSNVTCILLPTHPHFTQQRYTHKHTHIHTKHKHTSTETQTYAHTNTYTQNIPIYTNTNANVSCAHKYRYNAHNKI